MAIEQNLTQIRADIFSVISSAHPGSFQLERSPTAKLIGVTAGYLSNKQSEGNPC